MRCNVESKNWWRDIAKIDHFSITLWTPFGRLNFVLYTERERPLRDGPYSQNPINIRVCETPKIRGNRFFVVPVRVSRGQNWCFWGPVLGSPYGYWRLVFRPPKMPENSQKIFLKNFQNFPQNCHFEVFRGRNFSKVGIHQTTLSKVQTNRRWVITPLAPMHRHRFIALTRHHSVHASTELLITHLLRTLKLQHV